MAIAFLTYDYNGTFPNIIPAGCAYYRCLLPMTVSGHRARMGMPAWDPTRGFGVKESKSTAVFGFDTVVLKLIMYRWTPHQIRTAQSLGQRIIVDVDDYHEALTPANAAYHLTDPETNKKANRQYYEEVITSANTITVSTPFLYDVYSQRHHDVRLVRNGVNMRQFQRRKTTSGKPVIGWAGATSYRNNDLEQLRDWLPDLLERHDLTFHHAGHSAGSPSFAEITGIPTHRVTTSPIVPIHDYAAGLRFDIGLVPLNDIPFNHAKSSIKGLEYAASGIPFVASDLPEYRYLHESGVGRIAATTDDWASQVEELLQYKLRKQEAARNYTAVAAEWAIEARAEEWQDVFAS
jgi:glycosyltransferase involved in cell wall biosynthesis